MYIPTYHSEEGRGGNQGRLSCLQFSQKSLCVMFRSPPEGYRRRWSSSGQWLVPGEGGDHPQAVGGLIHGDHVAGFWGGCRGLGQGEGVRCQRRR